MLNLPISRDGFLWAFSISSQINRVPLAANLVLQKFPPPYTLGSFRAAAEQEGMKIRQKAVPNSQLTRLPLPCLVTLMPAVEAVPMAVSGNTAVAQHTVKEYQIALLESIDEKGVVLVEACSKSAITLSRPAFEKRFAGEVLIIGPHAAAGSDVPEVGKSINAGDANEDQGQISMAQSGWLRAVLGIAR